MNIVQLSEVRHEVLDVDALVQQVKHLNTKLSQIKHEKELILEKLEPCLTAQHKLLGRNAKLLATRTPYMTSRLDQKLLKEEFPDIAELCTAQKEIKGRWTWV